MVKWWHITWCCVCMAILNKSFAVYIDYLELSFDFAFAYSFGQCTG